MGELPRNRLLESNAMQFPASHLPVDTT
ncbi:MAG: hypothetical protein RLZZ259_393, partial [Pseudomonadota bacterium]